MEALILGNVLLLIKIAVVKQVQIGSRTENPPIGCPQTRRAEACEVNHFPKSMFIGGGTEDVNRDSTWSLCIFNVLG